MFPRLHAQWPSRFATPGPSSDDRQTDPQWRGPVWTRTGAAELMGQTAKRTTTITVDLDELKAPWQAWCDEHEHQETPKRERATACIELNLTASELGAPKRMAGHEGYLPTEWVVAMVRTRLTGELHVEQLELEGAARSNQQLLALGRNLNQITRVLNTAPQNRAAFRVEDITELSRVIEAHTKKVSDVLRGTVGRWQLQWSRQPTRSSSDETSGGVGSSMFQPRPHGCRRCCGMSTMRQWRCMLRRCSGCSKWLRMR